jgi:hypothetical protein
MDLDEFFKSRNFSLNEIKHYLREDYKFLNQSANFYINKDDYYVEKLKAVQKLIEEIVEYAKQNNIDLNF